MSKKESMQEDGTGLLADVEDEATELATKEDEADSPEKQGVKAAGSSQMGTVVGLANSKTLQDETEINVEDLKRTITFSPSITEAVNDIVQPMPELIIPRIYMDHEQTILHKALHRVKEDISETKACAEIIKMYDLYTSSLVDNHVLENQCHQLQEKVKQYEARHQWDPRILKVLLIAERYRQDKEHVDDEKNDLESEVIDMTMEIKHMEDVLKNKYKDIAKFQEELKKLKDLEKQMESLETQLIKKDNEIHAIQEQQEILLAANAKLEQMTAHASNHRLSYQTQDEGKPGGTERDHMQKIEQCQTEKWALKAELDERLKYLQAATNKLSAYRTEIKELDALRKENAKHMDKMHSENVRILNTCNVLDKKLLLVKDQLSLARSEIGCLKGSLEIANVNSATVSHQLSAKQKENESCHQQISKEKDKLVKLKADYEQCQKHLKISNQESRSKDHEIGLKSRKITDKVLECENLRGKVFKLETMKARHRELMKLSHLNSLNMIREIAELRTNLTFEKTALGKANDAMQRMQTQIEALQKEYLNMLDKNLLLVRNQEMTSATIEQYESKRFATDRRIAHLIKTNIDLYTQTTSQQEIALVQNHQFQLKENEIKGLLSRLEEEDKKMQGMIGRDKEKRGVIEQLHVEVTQREEKIKTLKGIIESYTQLNKSISDKAEELTAQLRICTTQKELIRRQRDLFGTKLLQSKTETQLSQESLRCANDTMTKYSVEYYNMQNDIRVLKLEIKNLRRKLKLGECSLDLIQTLRQELGQTSKALELEKCKNVILEETKMPNVHRWRGMLASDPSKYEMVLKNQLLIKRLISKTKDVARLEELLKQKDTMYMSLRVLVYRRMNAQLSPEMSGASATIRKQHRQIKALTAELNVASSNLTDSKRKENEHKERLHDALRESSRLKMEKISLFDQTNEMAKRNGFNPLGKPCPLPKIPSKVDELFPGIEPPK